MYHPELTPGRMFTWPMGNGSFPEEDIIAIEEAGNRLK